MNKIEIWSFGNDTLFDLVVSGRKTATCSLYNSDADISQIGEISIIENSVGKRIKIKTIAASVRRFRDIDSNWAIKEGEGDLSLDYWRRVHKDFFTKRLTTHGRKFDENIKLVCEEFVVV